MHPDRIREVFPRRFAPSAGGVRGAGARIAGVIALLVAGVSGVEARPPSTASNERSSAAAAPWGQLEYSTLFLEAPAHLIEAAPKPNQSPVWFFAGSDAASLARLFSQAGLSEALIADLMSPARCKPGRGGLTIVPSVETVIDLPPAARQVIYESLARSPENGYHETPQLILDDVTTWLQGTQLSATQKKMWERMLWRKGRAAAFSDLSVLIQLAASNAEIIAARAAMTRVKTLSVRVRPGAGVSREAFVEYWTAGGRNEDSAPLLRGLTERDGDALNIALLLPTLCRERLYTYPSLGDMVGGRLPDCHWTALNFFAERPEPYLGDARASYLELTQTCDQIPRPSQLGDVICFVNAEGVVFHSCVYIADNVVFTKNGENLLMPWMLMKLETVAFIYDNGGANRAIFFRPKPRP